MQKCGENYIILTILTIILNKQYIIRKVICFIYLVSYLLVEQYWSKLKSTKWPS